MKWLSIVLLVSLSASTLAKVQEKIYLNHYFVTPEKGETLREAMRRESPIRQNGKRYFGQTEWTVSPIYRTEIRRSLCYITDVNVHLKVKFTLPKLHMDNIEDSIQDNFELFYQALTEHEKGHQELGREAAESIYHYLSNLVPHFQCQKLTDDARLAINTRIQEYKQRNQEYDRLTQFGATQGAVIR